MPGDKAETSMRVGDEEENYYITRLQFQEITLTWTIEDFDYVCKTMKVIESPKFSSTKTDEVKWYLRFEPAELKTDNEEKFTMFLRNTANVQKRIKGRFSILNSNKVGPNFTWDLEFCLTSIFWKKTGSYFYKELEWDKSETKTIQVLCKFSILDSIKDFIPKPIVSLYRTDNLLNQIKQFYDDQTFKDITFKVKDQEFKAHKMILILRSPVFAVMFKSQITEELKPVVEIEDIKPRIFQKMLRFIYTDKVGNLKELSVELYYAAEKYQLEKLKRMCIDSLYENVSLETVVKSLEVAEMFSIPHLKKKCLKYLVLNLEVLEETSSFAELIDNYPSFASEIIKAQKTMNHEIDDVNYSAKTVCEYK